MQAMLPEKMQDELALKFDTGEKDLEKLVASIVGYANGFRFDKKAKGPDDMDVDHKDHDGKAGGYSADDWKAYAEMLEWNMCAPCDLATDDGSASMSSELSEQVD